eukprot:COSAG01_NODE_6822_length_3483_cov_7.965426_2_plen_391_part_00
MGSQAKVLQPAVGDMVECWFPEETGGLGWEVGTVSWVEPGGAHFRVTYSGEEDPTEVITDMMGDKSWRFAAPPEAAIAGEASGCGSRMSQARKRKQVELVPPTSAAATRCRRRPAEKAAPCTAAARTLEIQNADHALWAFALNANTRVIRARQFTQEAAWLDRTAPAYWAVNNGYLASCARCVPPKVKTPEEADTYFQKPAGQILEYLTGSGYHYGTKGLMKYVTGYLRFAQMRLGDVVALQVNEGPGRQVFYFGQVESNQVIIVSENELKTSYGFPTHVLDWENSNPWRCKRMMLRRVQWQRRAVARDLPWQATSKSEQRSVNWLLEAFSPFWLSDVTMTGKAKKKPVVATDILRSTAFRDSSYAFTLPVARSREKDHEAWAKGIRGTP